ncbi:MAG: hypothetical protein CMI52_00555 [Parcubacteria group bacterium]|nr:hypothetical protein [Parcubacteria group bacterium]|tara:strand:- start:263 stop:991 length:729 start_codon:yes stop_codon:yes gene_type:complete
MSLKTKNLEKHFDGVHAVDHLSIEIKPGVITGILGPNGSGKTTLINVISGIHPIDGGEIAIGSQTFSSIKRHEVPDFDITRTFQNVRVFEQMTVMDNLLVILSSRSVLTSLRQRATPKQLDRAQEVLKKVGLWEKRNSLASKLSYGQRKLLEVGRVLAMDKKINLFDEPFAGMFPEMVKRVSGILQNLKQCGKTIVLIEHNMQLIRELCDYVIVMDAGKLLAQGEPEKVLAQKNVIEAYLGE